MAKATGRERIALFTPAFLEGLRWWVKTDRKVALRIFDLLDAVLRDPLEGLGKPEPLKHGGPGTSSRRISQEHRLVYSVGAERIDFLQARYHY